MNTVKWTLKRIQMMIEHAKEYMIMDFFKKNQLIVYKIVSPSAHLAIDKPVLTVSTT